MSAVRVEASIERITPAKAGRMLEQNRRNRKLTRKAVLALAEAIRRGEWQINGEAIKFADDGRLLDGQHRLNAIVEAGTPVDTLVVRGLNSDVFKTIDTGRVRKSNDVLSVRGVKYATGCGTALRTLAWYLTGDMHERSIRLTHTQLLELADEHAELIEGSEVVMCRPLVTPLLPQSVQIFLWYGMTRIDAEAAHAFFKGLANPGHAPPSGSARGQVIRALRGKLEGFDAFGEPPRPAYKRGWCMTAWNAFIAGESVSRFGDHGASSARFRPEPFET